MKNLLLILLLANILYLMWGMFTEEESQPGVEIVEQSDLGPPLETMANGDSVASIGAVLGAGEPSAMNAVIGRACVSIGPFKESSDADSAVLETTSEGMNATLRPTRAQIFVGHWVWVRDIEDDATAKEILRKLTAGGLTDAYIDRSDEEGLRISLGLFGDIAGAEKIELQARSLGLPAEVIPSTRERDVFFVDVGLPAGKGAGAIVEKYGEDRVLLRDDATCPR